jgi:hypothetical protein
MKVGAFELQIGGADLRQEIDVLGLAHDVHQADLS